MLNNIRLIFYLPDLKSYRDRVHLVSKIADCVDKAILVTSLKNIDLRKNLISESLEIIEIPKGRKFPGRTYFLASSIVSDLIKKHNINIVHDTFGHLILLFMFQKKKFPDCRFITSLYNLSEWDFLYYIWPMYRLKCLFNKNLRLWLLRIPLQRLLCSAADHIVLQAPGLIYRLRKTAHVPSARISWIPNNIRMNHSKEPEFLPAPTKKIRLLYVGGFCVAKGAYKLLKLLSYAKKKKILIEAVAIGGMVDLDQKFLTDKIKEFDVGSMVSILGRMSHDRVDGYMRESDWLFHMTDVDGSPRVVLEALSRGLPVIGSNHPGVEVLDPEKQFIYFASMSNLDSLIENLQAFKINNRKYFKIASQGYSYVKENFESISVRNRYIELYRHLRSDSIE